MESSSRRSKMNSIDYEFSDFIQEYQNILMVRMRMSISESARYIVDTIEDIEMAVKNDLSPQEYFNEELNAGNWEEEE